MSVRRLVLASQSPRRRQILTISGYDFDILPTQISEIPDENLNLTSQIRQLASDKAEACLKMGKFAEGQGFLILASDTVVVFGDQILGKPKDEKEARSFLGRLSGQTHDVITAVSLIDLPTGRRWNGHAVTKVSFNSLSNEQIEAYVASGDPFDKAGGYGIQNALASNFIAKTSGDYDTVVGLSMAIVEKGFRELGVDVSRRQTLIAENLATVNAEIAKATSGTGRARLVAVSKTKSAIDVVDAWLAGQRVFAENYAQEALPKISEVSELLKLATRSKDGESFTATPEIEWHFIGSLQSKKVKTVVGEFSLIHSVDRASLVDEIEKRAAEFAARTTSAFQQRCLLQINIADENTKGGVGRDEFFELFEHARKCRHIRLCGVMALPPLDDDETRARHRFAEVRKVFEAARARLEADRQNDFTELSMGTTHDFHLAIAEGATLVRIGTAIFGAR